MATVHVRLLGGFRVLLGEKQARFSTRKAESLFAYLLLNRGRPIMRESIASVFWPDSLETRARKNLNTTLWRIRKAIGDEAPGLEISVDERSLSLRIDDDVDVDLFRFHDMLASSKKLQGKRPVEELKEIEKIYYGDLMEGCSDEWCEEERRYTRGQYVGLLKDIVLACKDARDYQTGADYAQRVTAVDSLDEDGHRELMLLLYLSGNRTAALRQYECLRKLLREELGVEPTISTAELWERIRSDVGSMSTSACRSVFVTQPTKESSDGFMSLPLVGREAQLSFLVRLLERAGAGAGGAAAICGEAGVGKTKLVEALAVEAGLRGFELLSGKSVDIEDPAPYQVFIQALWPRLLVLEHLGDGTPSTLASLMDALAPDTIPLNNGRPPGGGRLLDNAIVTEALLGFLVGANRARPTLVILEDVHRIDRASAGLLAMLVGRASKSNILVVVTARTGEGIATDELISHLASEGALRLTLGRLVEGDTRRLIHSALRSRNVSLSVVQYLWRQTAGNPLFMLEFLRLLCAEGTLIKDRIGHWRFREGVRPTAPRLPVRVQEVVRRRIDLLDDSSRKTLVIAALLGMEVDLGLLRRLIGLTDEKLADATEPLLVEHLLEETNAGFRFPHESIRAVVLTLPSRARRRLLHLKVGRLKEQVSRGRTEDLSWHFEEAGDLEKAVNYAEASGDKARSVHANNDSVYWYTRAIEILTSSGTCNHAETLRRRCAILIKRQQSLDVLGDRSTQLADIDSINEIGSKLKDLSITALVRSLRATLFVRLSASTKAIEEARRARQAFRSLGDVRGEARSCLTIGHAYLSMGRYDRSLEFTRNALLLFEQAGSARDEANALVSQGFILACRSAFFDALDSFSRADQVLRRGKDPRGIAYSCLGKGAIHRFLGRARSSEIHLLKGMEFFRMVGDRVGEARGLLQLALTQVALGKLRAAVHSSRRALRAARGTGDIRAQIIILNNLGGEVYRRVGDFSRAKKCIEEALSLIAHSCKEENLSLYQESMAAILLDAGKAEEALTWSKASLTSCRPLEMGTGLRAEMNYRLGCVHLELGNRTRAINYLKSALKVHRKCEEKPLQIRTLVALSRGYLMSNDGKRALICSREALSLFKTVEGPDQARDVYWSQYQTLKAVGAHVAAERFLLRAHVAVTQQASELKGRMKARFLANIQTNRQILRANQEVGAALGERELSTSRAQA